jgi:curved DNA-binding protein CbpA
VITEDYYQVLKVEQLATLETIAKSYQQLALPLYPDRNSSWR